MLKLCIVKKICFVLSDSADHVCRIYLLDHVGTDQYIEYLHFRGTN